MATASIQLITPAPRTPLAPLPIRTPRSRTRTHQNADKVTSPTQNQDLVRLEHEALAFFCGMGFLC
jgi:hypothetical protein